MTKFTITVKATSITIDNGMEAMENLVVLLDMLTYEDEFVEETKTLGFMYDKQTDTLYLHKGVDISYIQKMLMNTEIKFDLYDEYDEMNFDYEEIIAPRDDDQVDVINFIAGMADHMENENESQLFLVKKPGFGKAEPYSRKIPAPNERGFISMGELKVGDVIYTDNGKHTTVTATYEQGIQPVYTVLFEDGRIAKCALPHLWSVYKNDEKELITMTTDEIRHDLIHNKYSIPLCQPIQDDDMDVRLALFASVYDANDSMITIDERGVAHRFISDKKLGTRSVDDFLQDIYRFGLCGKYHRESGMIEYYMGFNDGVFSMRILSIYFSHMERCKCITVDSPTKLYLTENFIVTHNTFCTGVGLCKLKVKTLIIMHRDQLRGQWENSLRKMCGLTSQDVHEIDSSEEIYAIAHNQHGYDYDVYLMTHATFRAGLKRLSTVEEAMNITKNLKIGFKVIDEAHLEFRDTILMDMVFNVKRNLYLTATDGRSSKEENSIFRHVFANALYYKPSAFLTDNNRPKKWVEYISVAINTNCNKNIYRYRVAGGRGMSPATYGRWVIAYDKKKTHIKCCTEIVKMVYESDPHAKILLFMPLIDLCEDCAFYITSTLDKDQTFKYDLDIRTINSKNSKKDNERAKHADVIVTTIGSCGTGTDIPGITTIISCSPFVSKITAAQVFGRIRYCGKICQYYDIYDVSVQMDYIWWKSRRKGLTPIALNVKNLTWYEDET